MLYTPEALFLNPRRMSRIDKTSFILRREKIVCARKTEGLERFLPSESIEPFDFVQSPVATIEIDSGLQSSIQDEIYSYKDRINHQETRNNKYYLREFTDITDYTSTSAVFTLATDKSLIAKIRRYLGSDPVLHNITYMESYTDPARPLTGSQLWHRDGEDVSNLKVWFFLDDVTDADGPTHVIDASSSERIARSLDYREGERVPDAIIEGFNPAIIKMVARAGDLKAFDSDRCFHMGSRVQSKSRRRVLLFHYVSRFCTYFWPDWLQGQSPKPFPSGFFGSDSEYLGELLYLRSPRCLGARPPKPSPQIF